MCIAFTLFFSLLPSLIAHAEISKSCMSAFFVSCFWSFTLPQLHYLGQFSAALALWGEPDSTLVQMHPLFQSKRAVRMWCVWSTEIIKQTTQWYTCLAENNWSLSNLTCGFWRLTKVFFCSFSSKLSRKQMNSFFSDTVTAMTIFGKGLQWLEKDGDLTLTFL